MAEKVIKKEFIYKAVSVLIAVVLWFFVAYAENPEKELWFKDIPITFAGEGVLEEAGFVRAASSKDKVSVKVRGSRSAIVALSSADIIATVDLSLAKEEKLYTLPVSIKFPVDGLTISDKKPYSVEVKIEKIITKEIGVTTEFQGVASDDVEVTECTLSDEKIKITGGTSAVESIVSAVVRPKLDEISRDKKITCAIELKNKDGEVGKFDGIKLSKTYTEADIKVNTAKVVPVKPVFEGRFKNKIKSSRVQGETVKIYGSYEKIKDIKEIETEPIIVSGKSETEKITAKFMLPEGVKTEADNAFVEVTIAKEDIINE